MIFAEYWHYGLDGKLRPACGSDSVVTIDGRFGIQRQHAYAREHYKRIKAVQPHYAGYVLRSGASYSDSRPLHGLPGVLTNGHTPFAPEEVSPDFIRNGRVI